MKANKGVVLALLAALLLVCGSVSVRAQQSGSTDQTDSSTKKKSKKKAKKGKKHSKKDAAIGNDMARNAANGRSDAGVRKNDAKGREHHPWAFSSWNVACKISGMKAPS